ncbi:hypothetical protein V1264_013768 [Littorina saxatilis]|uniref:Secreted protein n=1 Tax=Littorina saxatilis TaxID=31220 RepID=A0AAN9BQR7_9CAEN
MQTGSVLNLLALWCQAFECVHFNSSSSSAFNVIHFNIFNSFCEILAQASYTLTLLAFFSQKVVCVQIYFKIQAASVDFVQTGSVLKLLNLICLKKTESARVVRKFGKVSQTENNT